jgi:hypothetical protein
MPSCFFPDIPSANVSITQKLPMVNSSGACRRLSSALLVAEMLAIPTWFLEKDIMEASWQRVKRMQECQDLNFSTLTWRSTFYRWHHLRSHIPCVRISSPARVLELYLQHFETSVSVLAASRSSKAHDAPSINIFVNSSQPPASSPLAEKYFFIHKMITNVAQMSYASKFGALERVMCEGIYW